MDTFTTAVPSSFGRFLDYSDMDLDDKFVSEMLGYDVIVSMDYYTFTAEACSTHPNVFVLVSENIPHNYQYFTYRNGDVWKWINEIIYPNARHFIAVADTTRNALIADGVSPERITVICFWMFDENFYVPLHFSEATRAEVKLGFGIPPDQAVVLFVGGITQAKGISYLLQAMQYVSSDCTLVLCGDGDLGSWEPYIDSSYKSRVVHLGFRNKDDLLKLYNIADMLVLPSIPYYNVVEQFGRVLVEAMGCGLPCIASNIGGPSCIVDNGVTGFLVRPADPPSLANRINYLLYHPSERIRMGNAGKVKFLRQFASDVTAELVGKCIDEHIVL